MDISIMTSDSTSGATWRGGSQLQGSVSSDCKLLISSDFISGPDSIVLDTWGMEREHPWLPITEATHTPSHSHTTVGTDGSVMETRDMERGPQTSDTTHIPSLHLTTVGADSSIGNMMGMKMSWLPRVIFELLVDFPD
jgi:hypothetical protein